MIPPIPPGPEPPAPVPTDAVWRVLSEDVVSDWGSTGATYYGDVMSDNGAFVGTVTAGWSALNWYSTGLLLKDGHYYLAGQRNGYYCYVGYDGYMYRWNNAQWENFYYVATPFDAVPPDVLSYLANDNFTLRID